MKTYKVIVTMLFVIFLLFAGIVFAANYTIVTNAQGKTFNNTKDIPHNVAGLLLGTSKHIKSGKLNLYFLYRVDAAAKLYHANKVDFIIVSGNNDSKYYNEPRDFREALLKKGVLDEHIILDFAGVRTLDSVVRANNVFDQQKITIISQEFHNKRAIYLAEHAGMDVVGFNAQDVSLNYGIKVQIRELLARVKVFVDIIFGKQPAYTSIKPEIS